MELTVTISGKKIFKFLGWIQRGGDVRGISVWTHPSLSKCDKNLQ